MKGVKNLLTHICQNVTKVFTESSFLYANITSDIKLILKLMLIIQYIFSASFDLTLKMTRGKGGPGLVS